MQKSNMQKRNMQKSNMQKSNSRLIVYLNIRLSYHLDILGAFVTGLVYLSIQVAKSAFVRSSHNKKFLCIDLIQVTWSFDPFDEYWNLSDEESNVLDNMN